MSELIQMTAPCLMGLEGIVAGELRRMDAQNVAADNGRVFFEGDMNILARANLRTRCAERILIVVGRFTALTFDQLFEGVKALPWERWIGRNEAFPVKGSSVSSKLFSVSDCQSIIKKAVVERLKATYHIPWFEETGAIHQIQFHIMKDEACIMLETSGAGLHKRGYRAHGVAAPIKETLAAAMVDLAIVKKDSIVYDPMCGSGTIVIEAAMKALGIAPGISRSFQCEQWECMDNACWREERELARSLVRTDAAFEGFGFDIDEQCIATAQENAQKAGVGEYLTFRRADVKNFAPQGERGTVFCNPPYGERLLSEEEARAVCKTLGRVFPRKPGWSYSIITPEEQFEQLFGRKADRRRKLYNGMIKCQLYSYYK
ncbi:MAG: class I SAM-dependent RNA methyltransferase [Ruminococcaceae bacterium]|nr:class I SAM-dependent RNA methyltransferase [Oscillospiraceae bacterium]